MPGPIPFAKLQIRSDNSGRMPIEPLEPRRLFATVPAGFTDAAFGTSIGSGTAMAFAPDGRLFVLSQDGRVRIIESDGDVDSALTLTVNKHSERGLLGIAFSPTFTSDHQLFLYYTELPTGEAIDYSGTTTNRVSRFTLNGNTIDPSSETLIVRLDPLSAGNHNGGGMAFGPDGKLYIGVGENAVPSNAQSTGNRLGKVLRLNADGSIPSDNPTTIAGIGTTSGANRAIFAAGLRNPYTLAFDPTNGRLLINDVGQSTFEEINVGVAGKNYGWPTTEGFFDAPDHPNFTNPIYAYNHDSTSTTGFAIAGGAVYRASSPQGFNDAYFGKYFFGDYVTGWINLIDPIMMTTTDHGTPFATNTPGIVDLDVGPDGALYYLQRGGTPGVRRIIADPRPTVRLSTTGTLSINGTPSDDDIVLNFRGSRLRVSTNGASTLYSPGAVKRINISAGAGDDVVKLATGVRAITADGGDGDDLLAGGDFADNLTGGNGRDTLIGYGGNDTLSGGGDRDSLVAGDGNDSLNGGTSIDYLFGGAGTDSSDSDRREKRNSIEILA